MRISEQQAMTTRASMTSTQQVETAAIQGSNREALPQQDVQPKTEEAPVTLQEATEAINEFMKAENKASKFVLHEGLGQYFVRLVDTKTEEVIKEIPPESLLNAFYEMKKLAGMIVDERI